jgi:ATP-binding cassette subfamily B protein
LCLAIVSRWYPLIALVLLTIYVVAYVLAGRHYRAVTQIIFGQSDAMRRAFYVRGLGLSSQMAKETRVFGLASWLVDQYRARSLAVLESVWARRDEGWRRATATFVVVAVVELVALRALALDAIGGTITLGVAVAVAQALLSAGMLTRYDDADAGLSEAERSITKIRELEASTAAAVRAVGSRSADGLPTDAICFEDVSFTYPGRTEPVLDHFDLRIDVGRSLALVGDNGAGKTTIVKLLTRLYEPTSGRITVDGIDLRELDPASWHRRVSALFQDYARFEIAAYDNVAFGALHAYDDRAAVERAAEQAGVQHVVERLGNGWQTTLSRQFRSGGELSGGEWQRIALARALFGVAEGAGVLILDEPTASLDVRGEAEIYQRFLALTRGVTTIVISHRFSTVRRADRIVVIEHGRVIEDGTHDSLMQHTDSRYARMYTLQASRFAPVD